MAGPFAIFFRDGDHPTGIRTRVARLATLRLTVAARNSKTKYDGCLWGAGLLIAALASMQIALSRGERDEWFQSSFITCFLVVALVCFVAFLWWDWRPENPAPVLNLHVVWREAPLRASLGIVMIVGAMLGAGLFVLPQYLRSVQDYSATQTGGFVSAYTSGLASGVVLSLRYGIARLGGAKLVAVGASIMCTACVIFIYIWTPTTPTWVLALATFLQGSDGGEETYREDYEG